MDTSKTAFTSTGRVDQEALELPEEVVKKLFADMVAQGYSATEVFALINIATNDARVDYVLDNLPGKLHAN